MPYDVQVIFVLMLAKVFIIAGVMICFAAISARLVTKYDIAGASWLVGAGLLTAGFALRLMFAG